MPDWGPDAMSSRFLEENGNSDFYVNSYDLFSLGPQLDFLKNTADQTKPVCGLPVCSLWASYLEFDADFNFSTPGKSPEQKNKLLS